jgi:MFS family permease
MTQVASLWRHPDFLRLWSAQFVSGIGSRVTRTVLPMLALLLIDATPTGLALLAACEVAPGLLVSMFAGGLADRRAKRPLLIGADLVRAALILSLPLLAFLGLLQIWQLYIVAACMGAATTLFAIVDNTFLPVLLPAGQLTEANAKLEASDAVAEGIGPWAGGVLVQAIGAPLALAVDGVSYLWSALLLSRIRTPERASTEAAATSLFGDAKEGLRRCRSHPALSVLLTVELLEALSGGFLMALYMVIGLQLLQISPATLGLIIGLGGVGAFLGALATSRIMRVLGERGALLTCLVVGRLFMLTIPLAIQFPQAGVWLLAAAQVFGDAAMVAFGILALSLRQREAPREVLGRVNASFHLISKAALLGGTVLAGLLALLLPLTVVIWIGTAIGLMTVPVMLRLAVLR